MVLNKTFRNALRFGGFTLGTVAVAYGVTRLVQYNQMRNNRVAYLDIDAGRTPTPLSAKVLAPVATFLPRKTFTVKRSVTINQSPETLYNFWRNFENLPKFMKHLEAVFVLSDTRSHWVAKGPAGMKVEWDAEITMDEKNQAIAWHSQPNSDIITDGVVSFRPSLGGRGTEVSVSLEYEQPGGLLGAAFTRLFGEYPQDQVREDLRRFKQLMETGELPTTVNQSSNRRKEHYDYAQEN